MRHTYGPRAFRLWSARLRAACLRACRLPAGVALAVVAAGLVAVPAYGVGAAGPTAGAGRLDVHPGSAAPGAEVTASTAACGADGTAQGDANSVGGGTFALAPGTPSGNATGRFRVPPSAQPGTYEIVARCSDGRAEMAGDLVVTLTAADERTHPRGSVKTGVGGALGPDPVQTAAGVAALAVAAAGGTWLLHRRVRGEGI